MIDYLSSKAASEGLAKRIRDWWSKRGYNICVRVEKERFGASVIHVVRSDYVPDPTKRGIE